MSMMAWRDCHRASWRSHQAANCNTTHKLVQLNRNILTAWSHERSGFREVVPSQAATSQITSTSGDLVSRHLDGVDMN